MRAFILRAIIIIGYLILVLMAGGTALAWYGPIHPGSAIFPVQDFAEQQFKMVYSDPVKEAGYSLTLLERRVVDLQWRTGSRYELIAVQALDKAINQASMVIAAISQDQGSALRTRLTDIAKQAEAKLKLLKHVPVEDPPAYQAIIAKVQTVQHMVGTIQVHNNELVLVPAIAAEAHNLASPPIASINSINSASGLIPWPPGSPGVIHAFYTLTGRHASLTCISCHDAGVYFGTPNQCVSCHFAKMPAVHYPGSCDLCHTTLAWTDIHFDHTVVNTIACVDCHAKDKPSNHYNGACSACHITENWTSVTFDHAVAGVVDCISCHADKAPANHYAGQCSNCHNTSNWTSVVFDHSGFSDCISCHANKAPAGHYSGQCSNCHNTSNWTSVTFNHTGFTDCQGCHSGAAPANHYPYQCSLCHSTSTWSGGQFSHGGSYTDCSSCHAKDRPADHDSGQCSNCHNTSGWGDGGGGGGDSLPSIPNASSVGSLLCTQCHHLPIVYSGEVIIQ